MTSRQRVRCALRFEKPDRLPIDIGGTQQTGIHVDEYLMLGRYLNIDVEAPKMFDQFQMLARLDEWVRKRLYSDVVLLEDTILTWGLENKDWKPWKTSLGNTVLVPGSFETVFEDRYQYIIDNTGKRLAYKSDNSLYFDKLPGIKSKFGEYEYTDPEKWRKSICLYTDDELKSLQYRAEFLYKYTDYSIFGGSDRGRLWSTSLFAGHGLEDWMCIMLTDTDYAAEMIQVCAERAIENFKLYLQAVGKYIDALVVSSSDYGSQKSELFNPDIFNSLYSPNMMLINDYIHKNSEVKTYYHSCGSIRKILKSMIDAGVDIINPLQFTADNMNPESIANEFSGKVVFWGGGVDSQTVLQFGTIKEVEEQVKKRIDILSSKNGYIFAPVHNIQPGVPIENLICAVDTAYTYGKEIYER
jgi:uroporphyrinogen decarboxylase